MAARLLEWIRGLGRVEKVFLALLALWAILRVAAPARGYVALLAFTLYILGLIVLFRGVRRWVRKAVWRLRNRLITAYLFIAVVPVLLVVLLAGVTTYWITGQVAGYLVASELNRRTAALARPAELIARMPAERRAQVLRDVVRVLAAQYPNVQVLVRRDQPEMRIPPESDLQAPPPGWKDTHGLVLRDGAAYAWAYARQGDVEAVLATRLDRDFLSSLVPALGNVMLLTGAEVDGKAPSKSKVNTQNRKPPAYRDRTPPAYNAADIEVRSWYPVPIQIWERPGETENGVLIVQTRTSAVLGQVFGHNLILETMEWGEFIWWAFLTISGLFLAVELVSLVIGVSLSRTITSAVDDMYEGTRRVMQGDFSHRITIRGNDQLSELGTSFNTMTANLERLIVVAKEKERLQSELEIAREVQNQLFPKNVPDMRTLEMTGVCKPARMVSGDYYDFMRLPDASLAFAIGDVAGKGISAALLMAAIQSTMRTQLNAGVAAAAGAGNGGCRVQVSTARLVATLNKQLYATTSPEKYATFFFGLYNDDSGELSYTNAGHLQPVLVRRGNPEQLDVTGTVVGAFPFTEYDEKCVRLVPGDLLVAYTDGIVEPENEYGEMFGDQRLTDLLVKYSDCGGEEVIARVMEAVHEWTGDGELQDDMTMLVARRL